MSCPFPWHDGRAWEGVTGTQGGNPQEPRTATGTDFLKPVMGSSFPSRAKRDVFKILLIRKFGWGCRISARAKAQNEVPGQSHVARKRCGGGSQNPPAANATPPPLFRRAAHPPTIIRAPPPRRAPV